MAPIDLISCLVADELTRRGDRLLERRRKQARFRDPQKNLDNFDFTFNPKMNRSLVFDLATAAFMAQVTMEASGRFGTLLAAYVQKKGMPLRELAARLDYTYEQMRKLWTGKSQPSKLLLKALCKELNMDLGEAERAVTADRMERDFAKNAYTVLGRDPRIADIEDLLPHVSKQEWEMFVAQLRGFVHQKRVGMKQCVHNLLTMARWL